MTNCKKSEKQLMRSINLLNVILICAMLFTNVNAQNKYKTLSNSDIIEYRKKDGLPSNNFTNVVQTNDGYLWFSGPEGTFRYDGYEFSYLGKEYGIPEMQSIFYDSTKNILYFASPEKFASFDGSKFKSYDNSTGYKLNENQGQIISFIKGDSKGRIWVGSYTPYTDKHFNGSLIRFDKEEFTLYDSLSFPLDNAKSFIETPFGDLIFTSYGKNTQTGDGAYIALYKRDRFTRIDGSFGFNYYNAVSDDNYSSFIDSKGNTWIPFSGNTNFAKGEHSRGSGILVYDGDSFQDFPGLNQYLVNKIRVAGIFCDNLNDKIYVNLFRIEPIKISSFDIQIFELQNNKWEPSPIIKDLFNASANEKLYPLDFNYNFTRFIKGSKEPYLTLAFSITGQSQSSIDPTQYFAKNSSEWKKIDAYNGIPILDMKNSTVLSTAKGIGFLTASNSIMLQKEDGVLFPGTSIPDLYLDRRGLVWITYSYSTIPSYISLGSYGLNVWDGKNLRKVTIDDGLKSNVTFEAYQDEDMNLWFPTDKGVTQIRELQNDDGEWIFKLKNIETKNRKDYNTTQVIETKNNELYVYQNFVRPDYGSILKANFFIGKIVKDEVVEIKSPFNAEFQKQPYQLYSMRGDNNGRLWLEGLFASSVEELSSVKTELKIFTGSEWIDPPATWKVPNEQLHFVGELDNGTYYLTAGHFYNFNGSEFIDLSDSTDQFADYRILKGASVAGTKTDIQSGKNLYIRLRGRGLAIFDGKNLKFFTATNSSLPTDIHNPVVDHFGNVFFGSHAGSVRLTGEDINLYYDDENITAGGPASTAIDMKGNVIKFYAGIGISIEKFKTESGTLRISSITIKDKPYYYKFPTDLTYSENSLLFNYSVLNFGSLDQTMYEHILEGYDKEWSRSSNLSFTEYQNLPPGKFKFKVRATVANNERVIESSFSFIITPPIWQTWWAYLIYVLIGFGFLYSVRAFELKRQRKNAAIKENQLRAEAAEAQSKVIQAENDRKTKELEEARELQLSMLPKDLPNLPNLDIAVYMQTATEVGGDYYDFHVGMDGTLTVVVGDATGHGMKAGTMVTTTKSLFNILAPNPDILTTFSEISRVIKGMKFHQLSMCLMLLKIKGDQLFVSSAAMPPALIYRKKSKMIEEIFMKGMPLGAMNNFPYSLKESHLETGDSILMLSDGLPELTNESNEMYGYDRTKTEFLSVGEKEPKEIVEHLKNTASQWANGKEPDDDVTFVVIKVK